MKVLIIDDNPDALAVARARLSNEHLEIVCAEGGKAGLEVAKLEVPDLILLDLDMPEICGFDVCRRLKGDSELGMIPVIFVSSSDDRQDKVKGLDLGAVDYVTKPFDAFELRARVRAALRSKRLQDLLIRRARIDPLTELSNRGALMDQLQKEWARRQRHGCALAFIMCDLDHFKRVNDKYGHYTGDMMLCQVAKVIAGHCRESDFPARYGGEEFAIIATEQDTEGAGNLAERYRQAIEKIRLEVGRNVIQTTASFGVADAEGLPSAAALMEHADKAMYRAKDAGRNRVELARYTQEASKPGLAS